MGTSAKSNLTDFTVPAVGGQVLYALLTIHGTSSKLGYVKTHILRHTCKTYLYKKKQFHWELTPLLCCVLLKKIPEDFNVFRLIQEMRTQRHSAVQTKVCFSFLHLS